MSTKVTLGVYRRLDNRREGLSDKSARALELHNRRKEALHEVLDGEAYIQVVSWGSTNDSLPYEYVELILSIAAPIAFQQIVVPGAQWLSQKLAEKIADKALTALIEWLVAKLHPKQEAKQLLDFQIRLSDGTFIHCDPPDRSGQLTISFADGKVESITYTHEALNVKAD